MTGADARVELDEDGPVEGGIRDEEAPPPPWSGAIVKIESLSGCRALVNILHVHAELLLPLCLGSDCTGL